jgi:GTP-binding protein EngB required for normal cell division
MKLLAWMKMCFTPDYTYTLDKTYGRDKEGCWLFKSYGSHIYVKKTWEQLSNENFIRNVNPKDISYIADTEALEKSNSSTFKIIEETRSGFITIANKHEKIKINTATLLADHELLEKVCSIDISKTAYSCGVKKGVEISRKISENNISGKKNILKLIK